MGQCKRFCSWEVQTCDSDGYLALEHAHDSNHCILTQKCFRLLARTNLRLWHASVGGHL